MAFDGYVFESSHQMEYSDGFVSNEDRELLRTVSESADPLSVSPLQVSISPKSPKSPGSPKCKQRTSKGSPINNDKHSNSFKDGRPKKGASPPSYFSLVFFECIKVIRYVTGTGGSGGKGTWGGLLETEEEGLQALDPSDPNYYSTEVIMYYTFFS